ncbi:unnamed protein product [Durusdinium trenchii]|uniref:Uncharacterized protein n=1 Tax=Durusdinium trenchii TaxID=1381693 RepID=A0ABP0KXD1_9DINO
MKLRLHDELVAAQCHRNEKSMPSSKTLPAVVIIRSPVFLMTSMGQEHPEHQRDHATTYVYVSDAGQIGGLDGPCASGTTSRSSRGTHECSPGDPSQIHITSPTMGAFQLLAVKCNSRCICFCVVAS